jgi:BirA family biotin operon repressor/biotin-[acetyl-CoA-carboxylase] ligase
MSASPVFNLPRLREGLKPFRLYYFPRLRSTNDHAAVLRHRGDLFAPAAVLTAHQTAGRGRGENTWHSEGGSLTVTFALAINDQLHPPQIPLLAGLATRAATAELAADNGIQLKWPNDLLYLNRKLAGLLCERVRGVDLIGIGLNINLDPITAPPELRSRITSLSAIRGQPINLTESLIILASHLRLTMDRATREPFPILLHEYDAHHALLGRKVSIQASDSDAPLRGRCEGLDDIGRLLVRAEGQLHHVIAGHVQVE